VPRAGPASIQPKRGREIHEARHCIPPTSRGCLTGGLMVQHRTKHKSRAPGCTSYKKGASRKAFPTSLEATPTQGTRLPLLFWRCSPDGQNLGRSSLPFLTSAPIYFCFVKMLYLFLLYLRSPIATAFFLFVEKTFSVEKGEGGPAAIFKEPFTFAY
jgi:hypothetical protein